MAQKLARYSLIQGKDDSSGSGTGAGSSVPASEEKKELTFFEIARVLRPYFWPNSGSDGAFLNRVRALSTWGAVILSKSCNLIAPFYLSSSANELMSGDYSSAVYNLIAYCAFRVGSSFFKELQSVIYVKVKQQASIELQVLTFTHLHTLSLNWHLSKKTGSVMKSMDRGIDAVGTLITYLFLFLLPALAECLAVVILFFAEYKQWGLGVLVAAGVILYAIATIAITEWRKKFREATNKHDNDFHDKATDSIINFETVKYFTAEVFEVNRFKDSVVKYQQYSSSTSISLSVLNVTQQVILNGALLGAMILSGQAVVKGQMTVGSWIAVQSWVATIFVPLNFLGSVYASIVQAMIDIRNLSQLLSELPDIVDFPGARDIPIAPYLAKASPGTIDFSRGRRSSYDEEQADDFVEVPLGIEMLASNPMTASVKNASKGVSVDFENVSFNYPSQSPTSGLKGLSFHVAPGTTTAIVGHTGSGKTTISRLLFRFYEPREGSVSLGGYDIRQYTQSSIRACIGIVPQDTVLFNDTILHNVRYGRMDATMAEIEAAVESAQIKTFIENLPEKWNTTVGERGLKLSGGEKQRIAIARCLLKNPPIVLLDEATSALDTVTENSVQEALNALGSQRTVLIIAHRLSTIRNADQIIVLDAGRIVEKGTHEQLLAIEDGFYQRLWRMQIRRPDDENTGSAAING